MIGSTRLLTLDTARKMDEFGNRAGRNEIAMIKVLCPKVALQIIDWAMQIHGSGGISNDFGLV